MSLSEEEKIASQQPITEETHKLLDYLLVKCAVMAALKQDYSAYLALARDLARIIEREGSHD